MIKAIIADDENHGRENLHRMLTKYCPDVEVIDKTNSVADTIEKIRQSKFDLLFLDIDMPDGTGFDVIEAFDNPDFEVIFVTAFDNYAIKAIKKSALDYIVKPFDETELIDAVHKAVIRKKDPSVSEKQLNVLKNYSKKQSPEKIVLPTEEGYVFVDVKSVVRCEAESNYTVFHLTNGSKVIVSRTLREYEELLAGSNFIRIHNSHLINMYHVKKYLKGKGGFVVMSDGTSVEVSVRKKAAFMEVFDRL